MLLSMGMALLLGSMLDARCSMDASAILSTAEPAYAEPAELCRVRCTAGRLSSARCQS